METADYTRDKEISAQTRRSRLSSSKSESIFGPLPKIKPHPAKPDMVVMFEGMNPKAKDDFRKSPEWKVCADYYNHLFNVIQENVSTYAFLMTIGAMPHGLVPYWGGMMVNPLHKPLGTDYDRLPKWHKDPSRDYYHMPDCGYAASGWKDPSACGCRGEGRG